MPSDKSFVQELAESLALGSLLDVLKRRFGSYELIEHFTQGEFHHDVVIKLERPEPVLRGAYLVIATNCNGGVKEVLSFGEVPDASALWHWRCPASPEFTGELPHLLERAVTSHWFDPCDLLRPDARSELRPEFRQRQAGGGWEMVPSACVRKRGS
jgi:hypothetical protein